MRALILIATSALALTACDASKEVSPNNNVVSENEVIGYDRCGEPIHKGQHPLNPDDGTPCK